jgi:hypothetical protein
MSPNHSNHPYCLIASRLLSHYPIGKCPRYAYDRRSNCLRKVGCGTCTVSRFCDPPTAKLSWPSWRGVLPDWDTPNIVTIDHEECAMSSESSEISTEALEDIAYLCRSANRVTILDALTEGPYSRRELANQTDASRTTLDRIVNELEERRWVERTTEGV